MGNRSHNVLTANAAVEALLRILDKTTPAIQRMMETMKESKEMQIAFLHKDRVSESPVLQTEQNGENEKTEDPRGIREEG